MATRAILILGAIMLTCGSAGLLLVRLTSPLLRGLGSLGWAFAAGGLGAALLLNGGKIPFALSVPIADLCVLAAFVLLHIAILDILETVPGVLSLSFLLLGLQAALDCAMLFLHGTGRVRAIAAGLLWALQAGQTAAVLLPHMRQRIRFPAIFVASLLGVVVVTNLVRCIALTLGFFRAPEEYSKAAAGTCAIFIAVALGLGFGIFWMSTTAMTAGLEQMASTDPLTRTFNRRVFLRWCERERERHEESANPFSILMVDLDHFKLVNDTHGHQTGDDVLCCAVEHMQNAIRGIDVLGRWGGEEFAVLLPGATADAASLVAERLRANVARMRRLKPASSHSKDESEIRITVSVGVATFTQASDTIQQVIKRADVALYEAKASGRNRVVVASLGSAPHSWIPTHATS